MRTRRTCTLAHLFRCSFPPPPTPVLVPPAAFNPAKVLHESNERQLQETPTFRAFFSYVAIRWFEILLHICRGGGWYTTSTLKPAMLWDFYVGFFRHSMQLPGYHFKLWMLSSVHCMDTKIFSCRRARCTARSWKHNNNKLLQLGCHPVAVVILHVHKTWNWLLINLSREGYMRSM